MVHGVVRPMITQPLLCHHVTEDFRMVEGVQGKESKFTLVVSE